MFLFPPLDASGKLLREDTMKHAPKIKATFCSQHYLAEVYGPKHCKDDELIKFVEFFESRTTLKSLQLIFIGCSFNLEDFRQISRVKVQEQVSSKIRFQGWDIREGPCPLTPSEYSREDKEFQTFVTELEKSMVSPHVA
jgi:hypothetical protein